jgi:hypothetical protein
MRILIACETSGRVRDAFRALGHDAISCDLLPSEAPGPHVKCDVRELVQIDNQWDMLIGFPDCTYVCGSGLHWNKRRPGRADKTAEAIDFFRWMLGLPIPRIALENPVGALSTAIRGPDLIFQPYHFGEDASKTTCLWLKGLPPLQPTKYHPPRLVLHEGRIRERWGNQTDSGQNKLGPSEDRWKDRARTYQGVADAMAAQWSEVHRQGGER